MNGLIFSNWQRATRIYKFTALITLLNLLIVSALWVTKADFGKLPIYLLFLLPLFWVLWFVCVIFEKNQPAFRLVVLWLLIDISVFCVMGLLAQGATPGPKSGEDVVYFIAFLPLLLPWFAVISAFPTFGDLLTAINHGASTVLLPNRTTGILTSWLEFSISSAISSVLFVYFLILFKYLKAKWRNHLG